jgi:predicted flap endonuclease-1-like 5' DNA nuclease
VFLPAARLERWIGITVSLATVVPAVLLPEQVLDRLGVWHELRARPVPLRPKQVRVAFWLGWAILALVLALPRYVYPLTWGAGWLIAEPLLYQQQPERSLFRDIARGSWGRMARLMAAGLFAGILWESFNALARGRWIYTVPFLERAKIFEMPPVGFLGFPFFALEVWSLYHLVAARSTRRAVLASLAVVGLALVGIDRWTVSSTAPELRDLPGVTNAVLGRLEAAGWDDVFRVARSPAAELAYRANLTPADARAAHEAARLVILRGIGTAHAAALIGGGIGTVEELAAADPEVVWRIARGPTRPTKAEVRVWVRGAQREAGAAPRGPGPGR